MLYWYNYVASFSACEYLSDAQITVEQCVWWEVSSSVFWNVSGQIRFTCTCRSCAHCTRAIRRDHVTQAEPERLVMVTKIYGNSGRCHSKLSAIRRPVVAHTFSVFQPVAECGLDCHVQVAEISNTAAAVPECFREYSTIQYACIIIYAYMDVHGSWLHLHVHVHSTCLVPRLPNLFNIYQGGGGWAGGWYPISCDKHWHDIMK